MSSNPLQPSAPARPAVPAGPIITLVYRVSAAKRDELLAFLTESFPFYESPGGIRMALYESADEPGLMVELVAYADAGSYAADQERVEKDPQMREVLERWHKLVEGPVEVRRLRPVPIGDANGNAKECSIREADRKTIEAVWRERWGLPIVTLRAVYQPADVQGLAAFDHEEHLCGLVTWAMADHAAEIVTLDALVAGHGYGAKLLLAAEEALARKGIGRVHLVTSNDNVRALAFYQRQGYRLIRVHLDAMNEARALKASVPMADERGVPLRDLWELEKGTLLG